MCLQQELANTPVHGVPPLTVENSFEVWSCLLHCGVEHVSIMSKMVNILNHVQATSAAVCPPEVVATAAVAVNYTPHVVVVVAAAGASNPDPDNAYNDAMMMLVLFLMMKQM